MLQTTERPLETQEQQAPLHMIRAEINTKEMERWMASRAIRDTDHGIHCLLTEVMGEDAPRPFRVMNLHENQSTTLYGYTRTDAAQLRQKLELFADPTQIKALPPDQLDSKPMPDHIPAGTRLSFETRVYPAIRTRVTPPNQAHQNRQDIPRKEYDAYLLSTLKAQPGQPVRTRDEAYKDWLLYQMNRKGGAQPDPESIQLIAFRLNQGRLSRNSSRITSPDAVMRGVLSVTDPQLFRNTLAQGLGRRISYGYGMLLLHPVISGH